jgi:hypothetical protein
VSTQSQLPVQPPWEKDVTVRWYSVYNYAAKWRRSPRTSRRWCLDGTLLKFGCRLYKDPAGDWWVGEDTAATV